MTEEETVQFLDEAQKLPVVTVDDLGGYENLSSKLQELRTKEEMNEYLSSFVKPTGNCWFCKESLILEWALVHGMAHCENCGIETKAYHYFEAKDDNKDKEKWVTTLQYHPKNYTAQPE